MMQTKQCRKCGQILPTDRFYKTCRGSLEATCKQCRSERRHEMRRMPVTSVDPVTERVCKVCNRLLPIAQFPKYRYAGVLKYSLSCRGCKYMKYFHSERNKYLKYKRDHGPEILERQREFYRKNRDRILKRKKELKLQKTIERLRGVKHGNNR